MKVIFYKKNINRAPVKDFIENLQPKDRARVLACLKSIEELGFDSPRIQFRQIRRYLWEIKIQSIDSVFRIFYVSLMNNTLILLHAYQKKSQKAPKKEIEIAE